MQFKNLKNGWFEIFLAVVLCVPRLLFGQVEVEGEVEGYWSLDDSPVVVRGNVIIPRGKTLQIQPGVKVVFAVFSRFTVEGRLLAFGGEERENNIVFTSIRDVTWIDYRRIQKPDDRAAMPGQEWDLIVFERQDPDMMSQMENVVIRYSRAGIHCRYAYPKLRNIFIERTAVEQLWFSEKEVAINEGQWTDYYTAELGLRCEISVAERSLYNREELEVNLSITNVSEKKLFQVEIPHVSVTDRGKAEIELVSGPERPIELDAGEHRNLTRRYRVNAKDEANMKLEFFVYTFERGEAYMSNYALSDTIQIFPHERPREEEVAVTPVITPPATPEEEETEAAPVPTVKKPFYKQWWFLAPAAAAVVTGTIILVSGKKDNGPDIIINGDQDLPTPPDLPKRR